MEHRCLVETYAPDPPTFFLLSKQLSIQSQVSMRTLVVPWGGRQSKGLSTRAFTSYLRSNSRSIIDVALEAHIILLLWSSCGSSVSKMGIIISRGVAIKIKQNEKNKIKQDDVHKVPIMVLKT